MSQPRPRDPTTIRSALHSFAASMMRSAAGPTRLSAVAVTPASTAARTAASADCAGTGSMPAVEREASTPTHRSSAPASSAAGLLPRARHRCRSSRRRPPRWSSWVRLLDRVKSQARSPPGRRRRRARGTPIRLFRVRSRAGRRRSRNAATRRARSPLHASRRNESTESGRLGSRADREDPRIRNDRRRPHPGARRRPRDDPRSEEREPPLRAADARRARRRLRDRGVHRRCPEAPDVVRQREGRAARGAAGTAPRPASTWRAR